MLQPVEVDILNVRGLVIGQDIGTCKVLGTFPGGLVKREAPPSNLPLVVRRAHEPATTVNISADAVVEDALHLVHAAVSKLTLGRVAGISCRRGGADNRGRG